MKIDIAFLELIVHTLLPCFEREQPPPLIEPIELIERQEMQKHHQVDLPKRKVGRVVYCAVLLRQ